MSEVTTIEVPKAVCDKLRAFAVARGLTAAQAIDVLIDAADARPKPTIGGYRSNDPLSAEEIDKELGV
ncbi:hypothetical protein [Nocardia caishijiensis]|uniref:Uncharacterized protein n=1 Tax=Nocardia caishijiensis TaxID=184756 RepID=A0ABQ6YU76_9NOCA|nr:hypothetical protein [Nocardia caishijiensis]KAF0849360.1 hypothetical protein FNL39_101798 [Nocardia caishijiensis]